MRSVARMILALAALWVVGLGDCCLAQIPPSGSGAGNIPPADISLGSGTTPGSGANAAAGGGTLPPAGSNLPNVGATGGANTGSNTGMGAGNSNIPQPNVPAATNPSGTGVAPSGNIPGATPGAASPSVPPTASPTNVPTNLPPTSGAAKDSTVAPLQIIPLKTMPKKAMPKSETEISKSVPPGALELNRNQPETTPKVGGELSTLPPKSNRITVLDASNAEENSKDEVMDLASPAALIRDALRESQGADRIEGEPLALADALAARASNASYDVLVAYWTLSEKIAAYHFALDERRRLQNLQSLPQDSVDVVSAARARAELRRRQAKIAVVESQHDLLAALSSLSLGAGELPVPKDIPHTGGYRTEYNAVVSRGVASPTIRRIHQTLPLEKDAIKAHAASLEALENLLSQRTAAYQKGQASLDSLISIHERLHGGRTEFLVAIRKYNVNIARYATLATPGHVTGSQLVPMLIRNASAPRNRVSSAPARADQTRSILRRSGVIVANGQRIDRSEILRASGTESGTTRRVIDDGWKPIDEP